MASTHETIAYAAGKLTELLDTTVLTGTIVEVNYVADTAKVNIGGTEYSNVPIFYHCAGSEVVAGGSVAFAEGDSVYVLNKEGVLTITGFVDGLKSCTWIENWESLISSSGLITDGTYEGHYYVKTSRSTTNGHRGDISIREGTDGSLLSPGMVSNRIAHVMTQDSEVLKIDLRLPESICKSDEAAICDFGGSIVVGYFGVVSEGWVYGTSKEKYPEYADLIYVSPPAPISMEDISKISYKFYLESFYPNIDQPDVPKIQCLKRNYLEGEEDCVDWHTCEEEVGKCLCNRLMFYGYVFITQLWWKHVETGAWGHLDHYNVGPIYGQKTGTARMVKTVSLSDAGSGYSVNDIIAISGGSPKATVFVTNVDGDGAVASIILRTRGNGYDESQPLPVSTTGGTGSGCKIQITSTERTGVWNWYPISAAIGPPSDFTDLVGKWETHDFITNATVVVAGVGAAGEITSMSLRAEGHSYKIGAVSTSGGSGSGCEINITSTKIVGTTGGIVTGVGLYSAGSGYSVGDILKLLEGPVNSIPYNDPAYNFMGVRFWTAATLQMNPYPEDWPGIYIKAYVDDIKITP